MHDFRKRPFHSLPRFTLASLRVITELVDVEPRREFQERRIRWNDAAVENVASPDLQIRVRELRRNECAVSKLVCQIAKAIAFKTLCWKAVILFVQRFCGWCFIN